MFIVYYDNGTSITEYELGWKHIPDMPITRLVYVLPNKKKLVLTGFSSYIIIKEWYQFVYGAKGKVLDTINVLGKYNDKVYQFSLHIRKGKAFQSKNELTAEFRPIKLNPIKGKDYSLELGQAIKISDTYWKKGFASKEIKVEII